MATLNLTPILEEEWSYFVDLGIVFEQRCKQIAQKIKLQLELDQREIAMYQQAHQRIEALLVERPHL
jgi:hypothetical protein